MRNPFAVIAGAAALALVAVAPAVAAPSAEQVARMMPTTTYETGPGERIPLEGGGTVPGLRAGPKSAGSPPPFALPSGGRAVARPEAGRPEAVRVTLYRPDGSAYAWATMEQGRYDQMAFLDAEGRPVITTAAEFGRARRAPYRAHKPDAPRPSRSAKRQNAACGPHYHNDLGIVLYAGQMGFYINADTWPAGMTQANTINSILYGADNWNSLQNWCGIADQANLLFFHQGYVNWSPGALDGGNAVGFVATMPAVGSCAQGDVIGCAIIWGAPHPYQVDIALKRDGYTWRGSNVAPVNFHPNWFDVEGVATHEFGHAAGLAHVSSTQEVMYPYISQGDTSLRRLGRGDAEYTNLKY